MIDDRHMPSACYNSFVCADCVGDEALQAFIRHDPESTECSFCGTFHEEAAAISVAALVNYIEDCLRTEYDYAVRHLPYDSAEGGYQWGPIWDTYDLLFDKIGLELPRDRDGQLEQLIMDCFGMEMWCEARPFSLRKDKLLRLSWLAFSQLVKHHRRFFFLDADVNPDPDDPDQLLQPGELLAFIGRTAERLGLVQVVPERTQVYRARRQSPGPLLRTPLQLGPPPVEKAVQNRMSPAGIAMFYTSEDPETALMEAVRDPGTYVVASFEFLRPARVLNLARIPAIPTIFDKTRNSDRSALRFLHDFARDLSQPVVRDGREHVEYIPTQVVTEYFRAMHVSHEVPLDGIAYVSSRNPGHLSHVFFANRGHLRLDPTDTEALTWAERGHQTEAWIRLVDATQHELEQ